MTNKNIYFLDDDNNIVSSDKATHFITRETDEKGNLIEETRGLTTKKPSNTNYNVLDESEITDEMQDIINNYRDKDGNYMFRK